MKRLSYLLPLTLCITLLCLVMKTNAQEATLRLEILNGHSGGGVLSVAVSTDGKFALTGSTDNTALLWDLNTGKQLRRFYRRDDTRMTDDGRKVERVVGHKDAVSAVDFSKDAKFVLTASYDGTVQLWETATGKQVRYFPRNINGNTAAFYRGKILTAKISPDGKLVAAAGEDKITHIWSLETGQQLFQIEHEGHVNSIAFSPDSTSLVTGEGKIARLFSTKTGKEFKQFVVNTIEIKSVAYSPDGKHILTNGNLWNIETGKERYFESNDVANFTETGKVIVSNGYEIIIWDHISDKRTSIKGKFGVLKILMTPDERRIMYTSGPLEGDWLSRLATSWQRENIRGEQNFHNFVSIIDVATQKEIGNLSGKSDIIQKLSSSPDYRNLFVGSLNYNNHYLWNLDNGQRSNNLMENLQTVGLRLSNTEDIAFSPNGASFLAVKDLSANIFDVENLNKLFSLNLRNPGYGENIIDFSKNGEFLLIGNRSKIYLFKLDEKKLNSNLEAIKTYTPSGFQMNDAKISPDGKTIIVASSKNSFELGGFAEVKIFDVETDSEREISSLDFQPVRSLAFSPDGKTIATASSNRVDTLKNGIGNAAKVNSIQLWDVETGKEIESFGGEFKLISNKFAGYKSVAYSPDGKFVAAGSFDGKVILRNNETKEIRKFEGHTDTVNSVKFAKDANGNLLIVSGSSDSTTRIWNASTGEEICALVTFRDGNWAVVQTKTGRYDAPNGGEIDGIQWVYGNETIALNQLKDIYYTPKLLPRLLGYNKEPLAKVPDLKNLKLFPKILEQTLDEKNARLTVRLQNRGGGIGPVRIAVNGKTVTEDARDEKLKANPFVENAVVTFDLKGSAFVSGKENKIEVFTNNYDAETKKGYISSRGSESLYTVKKTAEIKPPTLYAIIGGVSDYAGGSNIDLKFASKDAEDMATAVSLGAKRLFGTDKIKMTVLSTSGLAGTVLPTKENFKKAFEEVAKNAQPDDILFIYLSGHGVSLGLNTDTYFYLTQEAQSASKEALNNPDVRDATAISSTELTEWLTMREWVAGEKGIKAMKQVMVLDTCASGVAQEQFNLIAKKELSSDQVRAIERLKDRTGFFVLMGSTADAPSYEASRYGQGILTYALLQGMRGAALRDDEFIDVQKLFQYAADEVPKLAANIGGIQRPIISTPFGGASFDVGQLKTDDRKSVPIAAVKPILLRPRFSTGEEGDDTLGLIEGLSKKLEEASYANTRSGERKEASIVYIREGDLPGGIRVTGTYTIEGNIVKIKAFLRRDGKTIAALPEISVMKEKILEELLDAVHSQLSKINDKYR